jgi:hypothetical protein
MAVAAEINAVTWFEIPAKDLGRATESIHEKVI